MILMKRIFTICFACTSLMVNAQKDPAAKQVLDQVGEKVKTAKGIQVSLQLVSLNNKGKSMGAKQVSLKMKGEKYLLQEGKVEILCDGTSIYNFDGTNSISKSAVAESDQTLSPQKLLAGNYDKDFNYKLVAQNGKDATIELAPIDKRKNFQKVTLVIDKVKSALSSALILDKSNNSTQVKVVSIQFGAPLSDNLFIFNKSRYPKSVEIFD